ncbi:unnamed protein product [Polarella glacialis]|uniref:Uncharacterized protein n=1 Tax=Polarella glacialis TaxID=89957 RepID=A0A813JDZ4_POLGL|nr:unnamed protein product [Polarella glacialis]
MASMSQQARGGKRSLALGAIVTCGFVALHGSLVFVTPGPGMTKPLEANVWVSGFPTDRMEAPRGDTEPRTIMYNKPPNDRTRPHGSGRHTPMTNRKPVLAYSVADKRGANDQLEPATSVLGRLKRMMDTDYVSMVTMRQQFFRPDYRKKQWTADYNQRVGRKLKLRRVKERFDNAWQQWLRTEGRRRGLTEPIEFEGPKLAKYFTKEMDDASNPDVFQKNWPSKEEMKTDPKFKNKLPWAAFVPEEVEPGKWNDDSDENIFKIWKRPLHKHPYDIGKRGSNHVVRGNVF